MAGVVQLLHLVAAVVLLQVVLSTTIEQCYTCSTMHEAGCKAANIEHNDVSTSTLDIHYKLMQQPATVLFGVLVPAVFSWQQHRHLLLAILQADRPSSCSSSASATVQPAVRAVCDLNAAG